MKNLLGVVLCGGQSSRMGSDKGLLLLNGIPWASHVAARLKELPVPVVVSVNPGQISNYSNHFAPQELVVDAATVAVEGPLKGLLSVHRQYPTHDLLLMACDMIDMETATLRQLLQVREQEPEYNFYVYQEGEFAEPFGAVYGATGLAAVMQKLQAGSLPRNSLRSVLDNGDTKRLPLRHKQSFRNYNRM
ncbi:molybdenum cofactor guanylyltransferase [Pontibacter beigongshangensis]|uniref:molybdenum cofactor guanylyltransferase n=1 Tax=Pontibacter beigongshangensis TaxID=2574733 RepID=UPI0016500FDF|nr:molybdenum cofactor guanylyltransferase [Pontibacter beigongshangensis]